MFGSSKKTKDSSATPQLNVDFPLGSHTENEMLCHSSTSQAHVQEVQEVWVIAMATPPLTAKVPKDVLMEHFTELNKHPAEVECFKCHTRPYFKIRLKFPSQNEAETAIIRMNGSMLLDKHKLKLKFERTAQRSSAPPAASCCLEHKTATVPKASITVKQSSPAHILTSNSRNSEDKASSYTSVGGDKSKEKNVDHQHKQHRESSQSKDKSTITSSKTSKLCESKPTKVLFQSTCVVSKRIFQEYVE